MAGWTQLAICLIGNANCAISAESLKSILMRTDSKLIDLAVAEPGPAADGFLFGEKFVNDVGTFTALDNAKSSLHKIFCSPLFGRAG